MDLQSQSIDRQTIKKPYTGGSLIDSKHPLTLCANNFSIIIRNLCALVLF